MLAFVLLTAGSSLKLCKARAPKLFISMHLFINVVNTPLHCLRLEVCMYVNHVNHSCTLVGNSYHNSNINKITVIDIDVNCIVRCHLQQFPKSLYPTNVHINSETRIKVNVLRVF